MIHDKDTRRGSTLHLFKGLIYFRNNKTTGIGCEIAIDL